MRYVCLCLPTPGVCCRVQTERLSNFLLLQCYPSLPLQSAEDKLTVNDDGDVVPGDDIVSNESLDEVLENV